MSDNTYKTTFPVLFAVSAGHLLNDLIQSVIPSVYPMLKSNYDLTFTQVGLITFVFQITASILQPLVGNFTDKKPQPFAFVIGMIFSMAGILALAFASGFAMILLAVGLVGIGSSVFHPEGSRVAFYASGGKRGLAQSIFQLGGNGGSAIGPLLVAMVIIPFGQPFIAWFIIAALLGMGILSGVGAWYRRFLNSPSFSRSAAVEKKNGISDRKVTISLAILLILIFSKFFYMAAITNYFTFYLMDKFSIGIQESQLYLFAFLGAVAAGTLLGGPAGDRFGRKIIIWISILGAAPFTLLLPYTDLPLTVLLAVITGFIMASAFSAIIVYAQELVPGKIGMISGLFFGFAFGMGGLGSAILGYWADVTSINHVFYLCSFLPLIGIITVFLPDLKKVKD